MKNKKIIIISALVLAIFILFTTNVQALQSRPDSASLTNDGANYFFTEIRNMETEVLAKEMTLEETTYKDTSGNGVDVHMAKNTEWGTAAMLSASAYGSVPSRGSSASTTGNATGVYQMVEGNWEYVAGIYNAPNSYYISTIYSADSRYKDVYESETSKPGDATLETRRWKGASYDAFVGNGSCVFRRGRFGLFSYANERGGAYSGGSSRAVLVVGAGL